MLDFNDITSLKRAEERVRALSSRLMRLQDDERRHISRELHDSLGQYLTSMKINFDILKRESGSLGEEHRTLLVESAETLEKCVQEVDRGVGVSSEVIVRIKQGKTLQGIGLRGMYERVRESGGQLEIQSSGQGTAVSALLPLKLAGRQREGDEPKSRLAGKRMARREISDVRIESVAAERTGVRGNPAAGDPKLNRAPAAERRRASRR